MLANKLNEIRALHKQRSVKSNNVPPEILKDRLIKLVTRYGIDAVSLASGLRESTINQYMRAQYPNINPGKLNLAKEI